MSTRVLQVDLTARISDQIGLGGYERARVLLRYGPRVIGEVRVPIEDGLLLAADIHSAANSSHEVRDRVSHMILEHQLSRGESRSRSPSWTVVVCTRDRPEMLESCLQSLVAANDGSGEIIVVDNAPSNEATAQLVARYPVRYAREELPGLNRARMLGARLAAGDVVIYTDDDVVVDHNWIPALLEQFDGPRVGAVTGLTMPLELETEAQELFERYGGFTKGFRRFVCDWRSMSPPNAGAIGAGANMAFRRDLVLSMGLFEPELDMGTVARTGGDTYGLYRVLAEGYRIVYTPDALVWHRHRRDREALRRVLSGYGTGLYTFFTRCLIEHRDLPALRAGLAWFWRHHLRELARTLMRRPNHLPIDLVIAEIKGTLVAPFAYIRSRRAERSRVSVDDVATEREAAA